MSGGWDTEAGGPCGSPVELLVQAGEKLSWLWEEAGLDLTPGRNPCILNSEFHIEIQIPDVCWKTVGSDCSVYLFLRLLRSWSGPCAPDRWVPRFTAAPASPAPLVWPLRASV